MVLCKASEFLGVRIYGAFTKRNLIRLRLQPMTARLPVWDLLLSGCMYTYINSHTQAYIHTYIHADRQTDRQTDRQKDRQTDRQTYTHAKHTRMHALIPTYMHKHLQCIQAYAHTYMHKYIRIDLRQMCLHIYIYAQKLHHATAMSASVTWPWIFLLCPWRAQIQEGHTSVST